VSVTQQLVRREAPCRGSPCQGPQGRSVDLGSRTFVRTRPLSLVGVYRFGQNAHPSRRALQGTWFRTAVQCWRGPDFARGRLCPATKCQARRMKARRQHIATLAQLSTRISSAAVWARVPPSRRSVSRRQKHHPSRVMRACPRQCRPAHAQFASAKPMYHPQR
jgi:hypothetical protein